ncbi:hypothetical protein EB73_34825 [Mycobacterium sp. SWH-M3]|nr:hypothetical protein EB73_34825 [Mycobacterium sp. SWH-M3]
MNVATIQATAVPVDASAGTEVWVTTRDGVRLSVKVYGPQDATHTVILLHGLCLDRDCWTPHIGYLRRRFGPDIRIIAPDHRGHGRSGAAPVGTYRVDQLARDLDDVLLALGATRPLTIVGHSMGAMTAITYAAQANRNVEVDGLVLVATAAGKIAQRGLGRLLGLPAVTALIGMVEHTPAFALKQLAKPACSAMSRWLGCAHDQRLTLASIAAEALATTAVRTIVGFLASLAVYDQAVQSIHARTVVLSGGEDILTPVAHALDLVAGIPGAEHVHVPHAGHMLPQEVPAVVNAAICWAMAVDTTVAPPARERVPVWSRSIPGRSAMRYLIGAQNDSDPESSSAPSRREVRL